MKKARLLILFALIIVCTLTLFVGCKKKENISSVCLKDHDPNSAIEIAVGKFDFSAYTVLVTYDTGRVEEIALAENMISETDLVKLYQVGEHDITLSYASHTYTFKVSVKRNYFGELSFPENNVFTYNGKPYVIEVQGEIPANAVVTYPAGNSFVNAGTYDVTAVVSCDGYATVRLSTTVKIERAKYDMSGIRFEGGEFVYDGASHSVAIEGTLPEGVKAPTYTINGKQTASATNAGVYTVKASFTSDDPNYEPIPDMETTLTITPAEYKVNGVDIVFKRKDGTVIEGSTKVYDGADITFDLNDYSKISNKITVSFSVYDKNGALISTSNVLPNIINAGVYTVKVNFTHSGGENYKEIAPIERTFEVLKAEYPQLEGVEFISGQVQYDGTEHSIGIDEGTLPDNVTVTYEYYLGNVLIVDVLGNPVQAVTDAGRYTVKAIFSHNDENRGEIPSISATLNIEKIRIDTAILGLSSMTSVEYTGEGYEVTYSTWQELYEADFDILVYGTLKYYMYDADLGIYVEMGEGQRPTAIGLYRIMLDVSLADGFDKNYELTNGESSETIITSFEIEKKKLAAPNVTFEAEKNTPYTGEGQEIEFSCDAPSEIMTVSKKYFVSTATGYVELANGTLPVNAGAYKIVVTVTVNDPSHCSFPSGETSVQYSFEYIIDKKVINVNDLGLDVTGEYAYNNNDQRKTGFERIDYEIRKHLICDVMYVYYYDDYSGWTEAIYGVEARGYYSTQYYICVKDTTNVILQDGTYMVNVTYVYHRYYIV